MVRHFADMETGEIGKTPGAPGNTKITHILAGQQEMNGKGRVFGICQMPPEGMVPLHPHKGESETWFFLSGEGEFNDNGVPVPVKKGDVAHLFPGGAHGLRNTGSEALIYMTLVLFE